MLEQLAAGQVTLATVWFLGVSMGLTACTVTCLPFMGTWALGSRRAGSAKPCSTPACSSAGASSPIRCWQQWRGPPASGWLRRWAAPGAMP